MRPPRLALLVLLPIAACGETDNSESSHDDSNSTSATQNVTGNSAADSTSTAGTTADGASSTAVATGSDTAASASSQSSNNTSNSGAGGTSNATLSSSSVSAGGTQACPPCTAPPSPDCVGAGPCGCGPYTCPGTGGSGGGLAVLSCAQVSGDYGDCDAIVGYGFDGTDCKLYGGCGCGDDCNYIFPSAAGCANSCAEQGQCNAAALFGGGIAASFTEGAYCDEVFACAPTELQSDIETVLPLSSACESTASCTTTTCPSSLSGTIDGNAWTQACAASLLNGAQVTCWVWGP